MIRTLNKRIIKECKKGHKQGKYIWSLLAKLQHIHPIKICHAFQQTGSKHFFTNIRTRWPRWKFVWKCMNAYGLHTHRININSQVFSITPVSNVNKFLDKGNSFGLEIVQRFEIKKSLWTAEFKIIMWSIACKGQLILICPFGVFKSSKKPTKFFPGFLP